MEASERPQQGEAKPPRQRRGVVRALIVLASVLAFLAVFAVWANRQLLETDTWSDTSGKLLEDPEIRTQVADFMVASLYTNVDVQAQLQQALPPRAAPLAGPIAGAIRELATRAANQALQQPKVQQLWREANRNAQQTLLNVVEHGGSEPVTLDVGTLVDQLGQQVGVDTAGKVPPGVANIQIASNDQLVKVNTLLKIMRALAVVLTLVALALFALAIYLARDWRREALRSVGFAFIVVGILVLAARSLAGTVVVDALSSSNEAVKPAANNAWSIGTSLLNDQGGAMIFYGIFIVIGAWLSGPMGFARRARRAITPILERRGVAYLTLAILLILLFAWSPTPGFHRLPTAVLLIILAVVGLEFLRRKAVKDFPNETWEGATQRWSASLDSRFGGNP
jgi:hypothetical protein